MDKIRISDGITLNVINTDKFKTNYLSFNFVTPLCREKAALYTLIPQVLTRGTKKHKDIASIKNALDELYAASVEGRVYKRGEYHVCGITASWVADRYAIDGTKITEGTLDILQEIIFEPYTEDCVFSKSYVESEKSNLIDDIRAIINNKNGYAVRRCHQEMCKDESFGLCEYGDEDAVNMINETSLYSAYTELLSKSRIEIFFVGDLEPSYLCERIKKMFSYAVRDYKELDETYVIKNVSDVRNVNEKCKAAQGKLSLGFRIGACIGEEKYRAFPVFAEMYANSPVSKLFMNVREKLSLCYYVRAIPDGIKGIMVVTSGIEVSDKEKAQNEILLQLENVRQGKVTDQELLLAKMSLKNAYKELYDNPASLEGWYLTRALVGLNTTPEKVCEEFLNVTKQDVIDVANMISLDTVYFLEGTLDEEGEL